MALQVMLDIFSGLPNPIWSLACSEAGDLARLVAAMTNPATPIEPPGLGYRGLAVTADCPGLPAGQWRVFGGAASLGEATFADGGRALERALIETGRGRVGEDLLDMARAEFGREP